MPLTASDWRGNPVDPAFLIRIFNLWIDPAPSGWAWRLSHIAYGHGLPRLSAKFRGNTPPDKALWRSSAGLEIPVPIRDAEASLDVNAGSYYEPLKGPGPWTFDPDGPSDIISGIGMAVGIQPQPSKEEDNRYLLPLLWFEWTNEGGGIPPINPPTPPQEPISIARITVDVPEHMAGTFQGLARQATELARRSS